MSLRTLISQLMMKNLCRMSSHPKAQRGVHQRLVPVVVLLGVLAVCSVEAREIHVRGDATAGVQNGGLETPYVSINDAIKAARAGDTILVHPVDGGYREVASFHGHPGGESGRPVTLDGQGSVLIGSDVLPSEGWKFNAESGVYQRSDIRRVRLFLIVDGEMIFASKESPGHLQPGEWCLVEEVIHYKPPAGRNIREIVIEAAVRASGVRFTGKTSHVIVKNFEAQYFWGDGYNVHGEGKALEFYNCNARDMGDEGFSSHGDAETVLDGAVYENCLNGVFNVNTGGRTVTRNLTVRAPRALGYGVTPPGSAVHTLENAIFLDCPTAMRIGKNTTVTNAIVIGGGTAIAMEHGGVLRRAAVSGDAVPLRVKEAGFFEFSDVSFNAGKPIFIRSESPPAEVIRFDLCAVVSGLQMTGGRPFVGSAFEILSSVGNENREFPPMSTPEFLKSLRDGKLPGPSPELVGKAIKETRKSQE